MKLFNKFEYLPLGSITPMGWLENQLKLQAENITGPIGSYWEDLGENSGWLGGSGESWERGPYYLDGLIPLAWSLKDQKLINQAEKWIDWTINSQREDGFFGPGENTDWWPRMVIVKSLILYYEATEDKRVITFLEKYFQYHEEKIDDIPLDEWGEIRGAEEILAIHWLYRQTGNKGLLILADKLYEQTADWKTFFEDFPFPVPLKETIEKVMGNNDPTIFKVEDVAGKIPFYHHSHGVNMAMGLKAPVIRYQQIGERELLTALSSGFDKLLEYHGVANGLFTGDEHLAGNDPKQGIETCTVMEYLFSLEENYRITGDNIWADHLEKAAYNALPASMTADLSCHQYFQQVNQTECSLKKRDWYNGKDDSQIFGLEPNFGCCTANLHQGWPKFTRSLWMANRDGGLTAVSYAPCKVKTIHEGVLEFSVHTEYPFKPEINITIDNSDGQIIPIDLRIPQWCNNPVLILNNKKIKIEIIEQKVRIQKEWLKGDYLQLILNMEPIIRHWNNGSSSIELGPLTLSQKQDEIWTKIGGKEPYPDWSVSGQKEFKYCNPDDLLSGELTSFSISEKPFSAEKPPLKLSVNGNNNNPIEFIPYGCATVRISQFFNQKGVFKSEQE